MTESLDRMLTHVLVRNKHDLLPNQSCILIELHAVPETTLETSLRCIEVDSDHAWLNELFTGNLRSAVHHKFGLFGTRSVLTCLLSTSLTVDRASLRLFFTSPINYSFIMAPQIIPEADVGEIVEQPQATAPGKERERDPILSGDIANIGNAGGEQ